MIIKNIKISEEKLKEICNRHFIKELAVFGSALRDDFTDNSDIDILYVFEEKAHHGLFKIINIKEEFESLLGRRIDFISRKANEQSRNIYRKKAILENVKVIYAA